MCEWMRTTRAALGAVGLSTLVMGMALVAPLAQYAAAEGVDEDSVLIATRQAISENTADDDCLAPIAADADRTPDLADEALVAGDAKSDAKTDADSKTASDAAETTTSDVPDATASEEVPLDEALTEVARAQKRAAEQPAEEAPAETPAPLPVLPEYEPAKFSGIQPGTSTKDDLIKAWGEPGESIATSEGAVLTYHKDPFDAIDVLVTPDDVVAAVKIALAGKLEPQPLAEQLSLDKIDAVTVTDVAGKPVGQSFPERGVVFMFDSSLDAADTAPAVTHVVIQTLDAKAFALRAERQLHGPYEQNIRDLETALTIDPKLSEAQALLCEIYLATGQADLADAAATKALELEPDNGAYQVRKGQTLEMLGQYDDAVQQVRAVLDRDDVSPLVKAQALHEMAHLASLGSADIAAKAVSFENKAIEVVDQLATSKNVKERRAAKQLLVEAHLEMGSYVAQQSKGKQLEVVGEWFGRASGLAEDFIANDGGSLELRLLVARKALTTLAGLRSTRDPAAWVTEAEGTAKSLRSECDDPLRQKEIQWELGDVYLQALRIEHVRRQTDSALSYGNKAIQNLAEGAKSRQAVHSTEKLVGELYFQIGAVHAIHKGDHKTAAKWYDKAVPLLTSERPASELYSPRHEGEELVSMGVTYWQVGQKENALQLTEAGATLIEITVEDGIVSRTALAVPYGNLAAIYEQLGQTVDAAKYAQLANSAEQPELTAPAPRTSSTSAVVHSGSANRSSSQRQVASSSAAKPNSQATTPHTPRRFNTARAGAGSSTVR